MFLFSKNNVSCFHCGLFQHDDHDYNDSHHHHHYHHHYYHNRYWYSFVIVVDNASVITTSNLLLHIYLSQYLAGKVGSRMKCVRGRKQRTNDWSNRSPRVIYVGVCPDVKSIGKYSLLMAKMQPVVVCIPYAICAKTKSYSSGNVLFIIVKNIISPNVCLGYVGSPTYSNGC